jgi:hypothetical protein
MLKTVELNYTGLIISNDTDSRNYYYWVSFQLQRQMQILMEL